MVVGLAEQVNSKMGYLFNLKSIYSFMLCLNYTRKYLNLILKVNYFEKN